MEIKSCSIQQVKAGASAEHGTARVVFATMGVVDHDGDLTERGAFGRQRAAVVGAHQWKNPPIGSAEIYESGNEAVADVKFNLAMDAGLEWYKSVRFAAEQNLEQQYSYGFEILKSEPRRVEGRAVRVLKQLRVFEISPVLQGAGIGTRTLQVKGGMTMEDHASSVFDEVELLIQRCKEIAALRAKERRGASGAVRQVLSGLTQRFEILKSQLAGVDTTDTAGELYREFQATQARVAKLLKSPAELEAEEIFNSRKLAEELASKEAAKIQVEAMHRDFLLKNAANRHLHATGEQGRWTNY